MSENGKQFVIDNNDVKNQVKKLRLTEWVDRTKVADAIKNKDVVFIYYAGDETINKGYRTIEPFLLGRTKAGNLALRAWQQNGATDTGNNPTRKNDEIPGWRLFRLDGITSLSKTLRKFEQIRPDYNPNDKQMSEIILAVQPQDQTQQQTVSGNTSITKPDVTIDKAQDSNFFKTQADKFRNFFKSDKKPAGDFASSWIENQKRLFKELIKKKNNKEDAGN